MQSYLSAAAQGSAALEGWLARQDSSAFVLLAAEQGQLAQRVQLDCRGSVMRIDGSWMLSLAEIKSLRAGKTLLISILDYADHTKQGR